MTIAGGTTLIIAAGSASLTLLTSLVRADDTNGSASATAPPVAPSPPLPAPVPSTSAVAPSGTPMRQELARLDFRASDDSIPTLHVWSFNTEVPDASSRQFRANDPVCTAPCTAYLPRGTYRFGVSGERHHIEPVETAFRIDGPTALTGEYDDDRSTRVIGWTIVAVAGLVATVGFADAASRANSPGAAVGLLSLVVGVPIGLVFALNMDDATLTEAPTPQ